MKHPIEEAILFLLEIQSRDTDEQGTHAGEGTGKPRFARVRVCLRKKRACQRKKRLSRSAISPATPNTMASSRAR